MITFGINSHESWSERTVRKCMRKITEISSSENFKFMLQKATYDWKIIAVLSINVNNLVFNFYRS